MLKYINDYLSIKSSSDRRILSILAFIIGAFLSYILFFNHSLALLASKNDEKSAILQRLNQLKFNYADIFLPINKKQILNTYESELNASLIELKSLQNENKILAKRLDELSKSLPSTQDWAKFLDEITRFAKQNNISITNIKNHQKTPILGHISQILTLEILAKAQFKDILMFLNQIELGIENIDIKRLQISSSENLLNLELELGIWGLKK